MEEWGITDEEIDLSMMYDLLREQFCNSNDLWVKETLDWWNECVLAFPRPTLSPQTIVQTGFSESYQQQCRFP